MKKKILFIGGAPKCGTSALFDLLTQTKFFLASDPKETFYFMDQDYPTLNTKANYWKNGFKGFDNFFPSASTEHFRLEGSTHLIYQKSIPAILSREDCRFLFILREPANRISSSFQYSLNNLAAFSVSLSFENYVDILLKRDVDKLNKYIKSPMSLDILKKELELSCYVYHLRNWYELIPQDKIKIVLYEDLINSSEGILANILGWLKLDYNARYMLNSKNRTAGVRNKNLHRKLQPINKLLPTGRVKQILKNTYFKFQYKDINPNQADERAITLLRQYFIKPNQQLQNELNIDISKWS